MTQNKRPAKIIEAHNDVNKKIIRAGKRALLGKESQKVARNYNSILGRRRHEHFAHHLEVVWRRRAMGCARIRKTAHRPGVLRLSFYELEASIISFQKSFFSVRTPPVYIEIRGLRRDLRPAGRLSRHTDLQQKERRSKSQQRPGAS